MAKKQKEEVLYSCVDVAIAWDCTPQSVRNKVKLHKIPHIKTVSGSIYFIGSIPPRPTLRVYNRN